jgi:hypothetical protein
VHPSHYSYRWLRHRSTVLYSVTSCSALTTQPCMLLPRRAHGGPFLGPAPRESPGICAGCHGKRACVLCGGLWACRCREKAPHESACTGPSRAHGRPSDRPLLASAWVGGVGRNVCQIVRGPNLCMGRCGFCCCFRRLADVSSLYFLPATYRLLADFSALNAVICIFCPLRKTNFKAFFH